MAEAHVESEKQIEDVIEVRKRKGIYDVIDKVRKSYDDIMDEFDDSSACGVNQTDSEITVFKFEVEKRKRKSELEHRREKEKRWNMRHDMAIPGDGTHLGDSPSLVNLVTLVSRRSHARNKQDEYLVPLSSWEPYDNQRRPNEISSQAVLGVKRDTEANDDIKTARSSVDSKTSLAGKIKNLIVRRCARWADKK